MVKKTPRSLRLLSELAYVPLSSLRHQCLLLLAEGAAQAGSVNQVPALRRSRRRSGDPHVCVALPDVHAGRGGPALFGGYIGSIERYSYRIANRIRRKHFSLPQVRSAHSA